MPPNIVWITLDSIRADHTSMLDYERDTTPSLDDIGGDGQSFKHCISSGTGTSASSGSNLTGTYPFRHGLNITNDYLPGSLDTVPELLRDVGYTTACLSRNSYLSSGTGLDRGFDRFEWIASSTLASAVSPTTLAKYLKNIRRHSAGLTLDTAKHATPYLINETATEWLDSLQNETPFFFYLHYNEPHRPYYPPLPYLDRYTDSLALTPTEAAEFSMDVHENAHELIANGLDFTDDEWAALAAMYDAEIAYTDEMVGRLVEQIKALPIGETIFVITADHGELFGEDGLLSHKVVVNDALTHVPLVTAGLDEIDHQTDELVQHVDVVRTLLEIAGADTEQQQGIDLRSEVRKHAYVQRGKQDFDIFHQYNPAFDTSAFHHDAVTGIRTKDFRYQKSTDKAALFELADESTDVIDDYSAVRDRLDATLEDWLETHGATVEATEDSELTEDMRRQLRDLGYVE